MRVSLSEKHHGVPSCLFLQSVEFQTDNRSEILDFLKFLKQNSDKKSYFTVSFATDHLIRIFTSSVFLNVIAAIPQAMCVQFSGKMFQSQMLTGPIEEH
jgi:hypothetical protein